MNKIFKLNDHRKILFDSASIFIIKVAGAGFSFIFSILISNMYEASGVGLYYLAISVLNIIMIVSKFGLENSLIKYIAILYNKKCGGSIREIEKKSIIFSSILSIILTIIVICFSDVISNKFFHKENLKGILNIIILATLPYTLCNIFSSIIKGIGEIKKALFYESALIPFLNVLLMGLTIYTFKNSSYISIGVVYVSSSLIAVLVIFLNWNNSKKRLNNNVDENFQYKDVIDTARPLLLVASTNYLLSSTDTVMLGLLKSEAEVGIYNIASKITMLPSMLLVAVNSVLGVRFSVLYNEGKKDELKKLIQKSSRLMVLAAFVICGCFIIFAELILSLFGSSFIGAEKIIYVVSIGQFFLLSTGPVATLLMMTGHENLHRNNTLFCAFINIILNALLIPQYGAFGAALATSISIIIKNLVAVGIVYKRLKIFIYW